MTFSLPGHTTFHDENLKDFIIKMAREHSGESAPPNTASKDIIDSLTEEKKQILEHVRGLENKLVLQTTMIDELSTQVKSLVAQKAEKTDVIKVEKKLQEIAEELQQLSEDN